MNSVYIRTTDFVCPATAEAFDTFRERVLRDMTRSLGQCPFDRVPPLNPRVVEEVDAGTHIRRRVCYGNTSDDVVRAYLLSPKDMCGKRPAIICLPGSYMTSNCGKEVAAGLVRPDHGHDDDPEAYARDLALAGYVTLTPDYPCAGDRTTPGLKSHDTTVFDRRFPNWTRVGMSLWDIGRAIDFLETRAEVDAGHIGCMGLSQGGQMTLFGAAAHPRIRAAVSVCGWSPFRGTDVTPLMASYNFPRLRGYVETNRTLPFDLDHVAAMIAPRPFLNIAATGDRYFPNQAQLAEAEEHVRCVYRLLGADDRFMPVHLEGEHRYTVECARLTLGWFRAHL